MPGWAAVLLIDAKCHPCCEFFCSSYAAVRLPVHNQTALKENEPMSRKMVTIDGNQACTHVAYATSEVITIYPITPSSPMAAEADAKANAKQENIWGSIPVISQLQTARSCR